ncbi:MAG: hypothetical protein FWC09_10450, partial [Lachnospiraceae bacterium]|nr:hypothetical protein [Lachnospiraceae bacterium]
MSSLSKIVNAMGGVRTTNGWDIICCYNQEKINKIFAKKHKENKIISTAAFSGIIKLPFVGEVTFTSELKLGAPKIAFSEDVNKQCKLLMDIIGGYISMRAKDGEEKREDFPANAAVITCYAPIAAASGDWNEISNGDKPIIFKGHGSAQHIFLHFKNDEHTTFTLSAKAG